MLPSLLFQMSIILRSSVCYSTSDLLCDCNVISRKYYALSPLVVWAVGLTIISQGIRGRLVGGFRRCFLVARLVGGSLRMYCRSGLGINIFLGGEGWSVEISRGCVRKITFYLAGLTWML